MFFIAFLVVHSNASGVSDLICVGALILGDVSRLCELYELTTDTLARLWFVVRTIETCESLRSAERVYRLRWQK